MATDTRIKRVRRRRLFFPPILRNPTKIVLISVSIFFLLPILIPLILLSFPLVFLAVLVIFFCLRLEPAGGDAPAGLPSRFDDGERASMLQRYLEDQMAIVGSTVGGRESENLMRTATE